MDMLQIIENVGIDRWVRQFSRSPMQVNRVHECDAELLGCSALPGHLLAVTIDTVAEEIAAGLYRNPFTMGWITITASLSDLAAVGADPLGLVISVSAPPGVGDDFIAGVACGMEASCRATGTFILGGDTNQTAEVALTACALGTIPKGKALSRKGCRAGDILFLSRPAGAGNALGLVRLAGLPNGLFPEESYRPLPALRESRLVRDWASCCMDSSDGLLATIDQLMRLNGVGFEVECDWEKLLPPEVCRLCDRTATPPWMMLAGPHGEFALVFTVPPGSLNEFHRALEPHDWTPIRIGVVTAEPEIRLNFPRGRSVAIDMGYVRNLQPETGGDLGSYVQEFREYGKRMGLEDET